MYISGSHLVSGTAVYRLEEQRLMLVQTAVLSRVVVVDLKNRVLLEKHQKTHIRSLRKLLRPECTGVMYICRDCSRESCEQYGDILA